MNKHFSWFALGGLCLAIAWPASAITVQLPKGTPASTTKVIDTPAAPVGGAPTLDLAQGRVEAVDLAKRQLVIAGRTVGWHPSQLRVVGPGGYGASSPSALRKGSQIRFALDPASQAVDRLIVLIYIDQP